MSVSKPHVKGLLVVVYDLNRWMLANLNNVIFLAAIWWERLGK